MKKTIDSNEYFNNPSKGKRMFLGVMADIIGFIAEEPNAKYSIVVGTDSEYKGSSVRLSASSSGKPKLRSLANGNGVVSRKEKEGVGTADFVSVVTIHRVGKGGKFFWKKMPAVDTFDRHDRMVKEAYYSIDLAHRVMAELRDKLKDLLYEFEIHLDIGHNGPTKELIQEIVGMVAGNGFTARIKPESYAASIVADKFV